MNNVVKYAATGMAGLIVGTTVGFIIANKRAHKLLDSELARLDDAYRETMDDMKSRILKTGVYSTVEGTASVFMPEEHPGLETDFPEEEVEVEEDFPEIEDESEEESAGQVNVRALINKFKDQKVPASEFSKVTYPGKSAEDEFLDEFTAPEKPEFVSVRNPHGPYLISLDTFMNDDEETFTKVEMTYFEGDNVLIDSREQIVPDIERTIGKDSLNHFGEGTPDEDQLYVRNERLEIDVEVTRDSNTYTRVVLNIIPEDEVARSMIKPLKMRDSDDS